MTSIPPKPLEYFLEGNHTSKNIIVFLQGWPDNHHVWQPLEWDQTLKDNRLLFINFPNTSKTQEIIPWGQDFPTIVQRMKATFDAINLNKYQKKIALAHDWGCVYFYRFDKIYPGQFNDIIAMDVPPYVELKKISSKLFALTYQLILIIAFLIGGVPGSFLCKGMAKFMKYQPKYFDQLSGARCYPYFYYYKQMILSIFKKRNELSRPYVPSAPVVYLYASKKPFQFAGEKWNNYLMENARCENHAMDSGHWIMNKHGRFITDLVLRRLKAI